MIRSFASLESRDGAASTSALSGVQVRCARDVVVGRWRCVSTLPPGAEPRRAAIGRGAIARKAAHGISESGIRGRQAPVESRRWRGTPPESQGVRLWTNGRFARSGQRRRCETPLHGFRTPQRVTLRGDVAGAYVVVERRSDGSLVLAPDTSERSGAAPRRSTSPSVAQAASATPCPAGRTCASRRKEDVSSDAPTFAHRAGVVVRREYSRPRGCPARRPTRRRSHARGHRDLARAQPPSRPSLLR